MSDFDHHAEIYSKKIEKSIGLFGQDHDFFVRSKASVLLDTLSGLGGKKELRLLDIGCGVGLIHRYLVDQVAELHGVDISRDSLTVAQENMPRVTYTPYDGLTLPYGDHGFDCAYAICVMHHVPVPQWPLFVDEMKRVVKPGGLVLVFEHNPLNPATQWVVKNCDIDDDAVLLWPRRLRKLLDGAGLDAVTTRHIQFTPFSGSFFRRLDTWLGRVPLGTQYVAHGRVPR